MMVDSRATTARPSDNASETSAATFTLIDPSIALTLAAYIKTQVTLWLINYASPQ